MNVLAKTKKFFPKSSGDPKIKVHRRHPTFQAFLIAWNQLMNSETANVDEADFCSLRSRANTLKEQ